MSAKIEAACVEAGLREVSSHRVPGCNDEIARFVLRLRSVGPDTRIIAMNPQYLDEIRRLAATVRTDVSVESFAFCA